MSFSNRIERARGELRSAARSPLTWILLLVGVIHVVGIDWGLPASDGWDNDGVAPRDFLPGLAATFTPGQYYTYPPVHLALLALLTLPITLTAIARAPAVSVPGVMHEILRVPYMTAMAYVARFVALGMSLGIVLFVARIAEEIRAHELGIAPPERGPWKDERVMRVGFFVAAFVGVNASLTYYGKTTNLDVPYLFWALSGLLAFVRALTRRTPRLLRRAFLFAALAVGTKDQAYAMLIVSLPIALVLWTRDAWVREHKTTILRETCIATAIAIAVLALVDGAITNPSGFRARLHFLTGSASQDFAEYTPDWSGRVGIFRDAVEGFTLQYPYVLAIPIVIGLARTLVGVRRADPKRRATQLAVALLPLLVAVSFTVAFNFAARRTNARFLLAQAIMFAIYGGAGLEVLAFVPHRIARVAGRIAIVGALATALFTCVAVDANLLHDPRYDAEQWLASHVRPGDTIAIYGLNVYQPRLPVQARVIRLGPEPVDKRNPLPGVEEIQAPYGEAEAGGARWVILSTGWVWRYFQKSDFGQSGRQQTTLTRRIVTDEASAQFFDRLIGGKTAFGYAHESAYVDRVFPNVDVHGTSGRLIWIYERRPGS